MSKTLLVVLFAVLVPICGFAVDGQVLINQSTVMAAGGFPYVISLPGSYKLSGNLTVPGGANGIFITTSNVTLDLNGFNILVPTAPANPGNEGITASFGANGITIRNGSVVGFVYPLNPGTNGAGIGSAQSWTLQDLSLLSTLQGNTVLGFPLDGYALVVRVRAPQFQIFFPCPSVVTESVFFEVAINSQNPGVGSCVLTNNAVR